MKTQTEKVEEAAEHEVNAARYRDASRNGRKIFSNERKMSNSQKCFPCGGNYPHESFCPAHNKECFRCGKSGHFEKFCKSKIDRPTQFRDHRRNHDRRPINKVTHFSELTSSSDDEYLCCITTLFSEVNQISKDLKSNFHTIINIEQQRVQVLIDSGASINIMTTLISA